MIAKTPQSEVENTVPLEQTDPSLQMLIRPQSGGGKQHVVTSGNLASENTQMNTESSFAAHRQLNN